MVTDAVMLLQLRNDDFEGGVTIFGQEYQVGTCLEDLHPTYTIAVCGSKGAQVICPDCCLCLGA